MYTVNTYKKEDVIWFRKTKEEWGSFSNMCSGYPIKVNTIEIRTTEHLYQALKFPDYPEIQKKIIDTPSPMVAKWEARKYPDKVRKDWEDIKVEVMRYCISLKYLYHPDTFGRLLDLTNDKTIVEFSNKDTFWGCKLENDKFIGKNVLGNLLTICKHKGSSITESYPYSIELKLYGVRVMSNQSLISYFPTIQDCYIYSIRMLSEDKFFKLTYLHELDSVDNIEVWYNTLKEIIHKYPHKDMEVAYSILQNYKVWLLKHL